MKSQTKGTHYNICACARKGNNGRLKENMLVGVDHFFLYNNFSDDNYREILAPYIERGVVDLIDWPVPQGQFPAYEDCWQKFRETTRWIALIDLDEFLCPVYETSVGTWLEKYEKYPSVIVYWKMFGTSGRIEHDPEQLTIEQYTVCWDKMYNEGKVIINTGWSFSKIYHHIIYANYKIGPFQFHLWIPPVNEFGKFIRWEQIHRTRRNATVDNISFQLNHYWSRAYMMHYRKKEKGSMCENYRHSMRQFFNSEHRNRAVDYKIFRFLIELKLALGMGPKDMSCNRE